MSEESGFTSDDFTDGGYDALFGGEKLISLFDVSHKTGTVRKGVITKAPETRQSRFYSASGAGKLKFWGEDGKPTEDSRTVDGKPLRPCNDEVFVLQTEYRLDAAELQEKGMEPDDDTGLRGVFASGAQFKAIKGAIRDAKLKNRAQLVGMTLELKRAGKTQKGDFQAWVWEAKLTGTPAAPASPFSEADA